MNRLSLYFIRRYGKKCCYCLCRLSIYSQIQVKSGKKAEATNNNHLPIKNTKQYLSQCLSASAAKTKREIFNIARWWICLLMKLYQRGDVSVAAVNIQFLTAGSMLDMRKNPIWSNYSKFPISFEVEVGCFDDFFEVEEEKCHLKIVRSYGNVDWLLMSSWWSFIKSFYGKGLNRTEVKEKLPLKDEPPG